MKKEQLTKLYDLMKGLLLTYDDGIYDDEELQNVIYELDRIISDRINNKTSKDDLRWCNEIWKKYECNKLEDEMDKIVYREGRESGFCNINLRRTQLVLCDPTSIGYDKEHLYLKRRCFLNNEGKEHGLVTIWYENGQKKYEETLDGLFTKWYENGNKTYEMNWKDGKKDGLYTDWYKNGQKKEEGTFKDGKKDGKWTYWRTPSGEKDRVVIFNNGKVIKETLES